MSARRSFSAAKPGAKQHRRDDHRCDPEGENGVPIESINHGFRLAASALRTTQDQWKWLCNTMQRRFPSHGSTSQLENVSYGILSEALRLPEFYRMLTVIKVAAVAVAGSSSQHRQSVRGYYARKYRGRYDEIRQRHQARRRGGAARGPGTRRYRYRGGRDERRRRPYRIRQELRREIGSRSRGEARGGRAGSGKRSAGSSAQ